MVIDTSALVAILLEARFAAEGARDRDHFISRAGITLLSVDPAQGLIARDAWRRFGKGRHPAALNYGNCFAYALPLSTCP